MSRAAEDALELGELVCDRATTRIELVLDGLGRRAQLGRMSEYSELGVKSHIFTGLRRDRVDLQELKAKKLEAFNASLLGLSERGERLIGLPTRLKADGILREHVGETTEAIEHLTMRGDVEEGRVSVLAGDVDEGADDPLQLGEGREAPIQVSAALPSTGDDATRDQLPSEDVVHARGQEMSGCGAPVGQVEERFDAAFVASLPNELGALPVAENEGHGADDDGLTGAGLASEDRETRTERDLQVID